VGIVKTDPDRSNEAWQQARRRKLRRWSPVAPAPPAKPKRKPPIKQSFAYWPAAKVWFDAWVYDKGAPPRNRSKDYSRLIEHLLQMLSDRGHHPHKRTVQLKVEGWLAEYFREIR
jgi:hypothetical protein